MTLNNKMAELNAKMAAVRKQFQEEGQQLFGEAVKEIFEQYPILETVSFNGYVPYFNDGDTCVFHVNDYSLTVNGQSEDNYEGDVNTLAKETYQSTGKKVMQMQGWGDNRKEVEVDEKKFLPNPDFDPTLGAAYQAVRDLINATDESLFEDMFGSHFEVTITKDGISVEEYTDHD